MRSRVDDIESQADAVEDVTQFQVSGSDGTMVRQREYPINCTFCLPLI